MICGLYKKKKKGFKCSFILGLGGDADMVSIPNKIQVYLSWSERKSWLPDKYKKIFLIKCRKMKFGMDSFQC